MAAESPAASGAQPAEKFLPRDPALVLSTGKLYKLNTFILLRVPLLVQLPKNCCAVRMACFPSLLAVRILGNRFFLLFSGSIGCFSMLSGGSTVVPLELNCQVLRNSCKGRTEIPFWVLFFLWKMAILNTKAAFACFLYIPFHRLKFCCCLKSNWDYINPK